jgi:hypothetical protein
MAKGTLYILLIVVAMLCVYMVSLPDIKEHFLISDLKTKLAIIDPMFKELDVRESSSSFTEDKSIIYLCLRDDHGQFYPENTIMYVALHEIAHLINKKDYGHTPEFHRQFDKLLCLAAKKHVYDSEAPHPNFYCGVSLEGITFPSTCSRIIDLND